MYLFIIVIIIIIYLFVNVNCNFTHEALRTGFNVSMRSRFTFSLEFGNVFFQGEKNTGGPGEKISKKGRENSNHISRPLRDREHFKRGECSNHWAHPSGEGSLQEVSDSCGPPKVLNPNLFLKGNELTLISHRI